MAAPTYGLTGTVDPSSTAPVTPSYPTGITAGDLLTLFLGFHDTASLPNNGQWATPSGWTLIDRAVLTVGGVNAGELAIFGKLADGTESGTLSCDRTGDEGAATSQAGFITRWSKDAGADAWTDVADAFEDSWIITDEATPYDTGNMAITGEDRRFAAFVFANDNVQNTVGDADYTIGSRSTSTSGADCAFGVWYSTAGRGSSGSPYSDSFTQAADIEGCMVVVALKNHEASAIDGAVSLALTMDFTVAGTRIRDGAVALPLAMGYTVAGTRIRDGVVSLPLTINYVTEGTVSGGVVDGAVSMALTMGFTTEGRSVKTGAVSMPLSMSFTTEGTRIRDGAAVLPLTMSFTTSGEVVGGEAANIAKRMLMGLGF